MTEDTGNVYGLSGDPPDVTHDATEKHPEIVSADRIDDKDSPQHAERGADSELRNKLLLAYGRHLETDEVAPASDISLILDRILDMTDEAAVNILLHATESYADDPNFPGTMLGKIKVILQGYKIADMEYVDWSFELRSIAAMIHYHSPYPEVRSVTDPFDGPSIPVETLRCYVLGMCLMGGSSALNTFFSPRQPSINLSGLVLQCILAPLGQLCARFLPDWHIRFWKIDIALNPGPWTFKEQIFATIMMSVGNGAGGTYYTYLVQMLPQYLDQTWVNFGYEILLAIYAQMAGLGMAGVLRRFLIYPPAAIWPSVLPTLALNRTLVLPEKKGENIHGWTLSRYKFFMIAFGLMFIWFWIPNTFFTALHGFNWMTWIAPNNRNLATITGFYGGLGFNPWATFDWNVAGTGALVTPWFSAAQFYSGEVISGLVIICMYYSNYAWAQYMPINSNETFNNKGTQYNISEVMGDDGYINVDRYKEYGPPYYGGANVFGQGNLPAWYFMTLSYVTIRYWRTIKASAMSFWRSLRNRDGPLNDESDVHCRMMRSYKEVPDWWYLAIMLASVACGIAAISAFPTHTPWWSIIVCMVIGWIFLIPTSLITAITNKGIGLDILFKILSGTWFPGNPMALLILESIGPAFDSQTDTFMGQQKIGHYAKIPQRAIFRGMVISVLINAFIFIGVLNWMVHGYNNGTLCTWSNVQHFTCPTAVQDFTSAVMYGIYGTRNMYTMYPEVGWAMFLGLFTGVTTAVLQKYSYHIPQFFQRRLREDRFETVQRWIFAPLSKLEWFNPSVVWAGACATWTGGGNLSYHTNNLYISFTMMYYVKRRFPAWWEKYNFLLEAGFDIGVAVSGTIQTLTFAFSGAKFPSWWGNTVATAGVDFLMYNQKDALLPIPEKGYFGLEPSQYPVKYPKDLLDGKKGVIFDS